MWKWFNCYLSGRHDFGMWCEPGAIFLRCTHCGKRTSGWAVDPKMPAQVEKPTALAASRSAPRVIPFERVAAG